MLSKCASPDCVNAFRYLHEGRLYLIDYKAASARRGAPVDLKYGAGLGALEYVWLCSSCCRLLTIQLDDDHGVRVVRRLEIQDGGFETRSSLQLDQRRM